MKYLQYFVKIGLVIVGLIILLFTIKIVSVAGVIDDKSLYILHNMMRNSVFLPTLVLGIVALVGSFITKGDLSWYKYFLDNGKGWSCLALIALVILIGLQFYWYGIGLFLSATTF